MADLQKKINKYSAKGKKVSKRKKLVMSLAALVVFCTTYALILPALTMSGETFCGLEEHTHAEECYAEETVLVCTLPEESHAHNESCYVEIQELICSLSDSEIHHHSESCYGDESVLVCDLPQDENHSHSPECYELQRKLICGLEEGAPTHTHTEACYGTRKELACGLEESEGHVHTEECYCTQMVPCCGLEEHTHSLQCYSNPNADVETADIWERMFNGIEYSGEAGKDVITVAKTQLGYSESQKNYIVAEDGVTLYGYSRYGDWAGTPYNPWDALFCSFVLDRAGVTGQAGFPIAGKASEWVEALSSCGYFVAADSEYTPAPGDLIFFDTPDVNGFKDGVADRVGFVLEIDGEFVKTIEGDLGNAVANGCYALNDGTVFGYGKLPVAQDENLEDKVAEEEDLPSDVPPEDEANVSVITATASDGAVVTITGKLPEGAEAVITPVELTEEQYAQLVETYGEEKAATIAANYVAYDICIMVEGVEWEPDESVSVVVSRPAIEGSGEFGVTHVKEDNSMSELEASTDEEGKVSFETDGFSVYIFYPVEEGEDEEGKFLQAVSEEGITVTIRGAAEVFPFPVEELSVSITNIEPTEEQLALLAAAGAQSDNTRLVDITLWHGDEKIEPEGLVTVTISNICVMGEQVPIEQVAHITDEGVVEILEVKETEEGFSFETESFSTYQFTLSATTKNITYHIAVDDVIELSGSGTANHAWYSSNTGVIFGSVKVVDNVSIAVVNGLAAGSATVTHRYGANTSSLSNEKINITVHVASELQVEAGKNITLTSDTSGTWSSENTSLATVNTGVVTGVAEGSVRVRREYVSNGVTYANIYQITVLPESEYEVEVGSTLTLSENTSGTWSSDNTALATVNAGVVTGVEVGSVSVRHEYVSNGVTCTDTYQVTVKLATDGAEDIIPPAIYKSVDRESTVVDSFINNKTIDYLGDNKDDSSAYTNVKGRDYYRLYLDMTGDTLATDLLFIVDVSTSMRSDNTTGNKNDYDNNSNSRINHIRRFMNGFDGEPGFGSYFLSLNPRNKISVITFAGGGGTLSSNAAVVQDWGQTAMSNYALAINANHGTNYVDALTQAASQFDKVANDGNKKILIFLSDGAPTAFRLDGTEHVTRGTKYDAGMKNATQWYSYYPVATNASENIQCPTKKNEIVTKQFINSFKTSYSDVNIFTVCYFGSVVNDVARASIQDTLSFMASRPDQYFDATSASDLKTKMESIFRPYDVSITDYLSMNVEYYSDKPDVYVTRKNVSSGVEEILYCNGAPTTTGTGVIDSVTYTPTSDSMSSTGYVKCTFTQGKTNALWKDYLYTLSFNVKLTDVAKDKGTDYTEQGEKLTDWGTNATSSEKGGFFSNSSAEVEYKVGSTVYSEYYQQPVVQVDPVIILRKLVDAEDKSGSFTFKVTYVGTDGLWHTEEKSLSNYDEEAEGPELRITFLSGTKVTVEETGHDGYTVKYTVDGGTETRGSKFVSADKVTENITVVFTNTPGSELPHTGGSGTGFYYGVGGTLAILALVELILIKRRRSKENEA